jgi:hypothetical protein
MPEPEPEAGAGSRNRRRKPEPALISGGGRGGLPGGILVEMIAHAGGRTSHATAAKY